MSNTSRVSPGSAVGSQGPRRWRQHLGCHGLPSQQRPVSLDDTAERLIAKMGAEAEAVRLKQFRNNAHACFRDGVGIVVRCRTPSGVAQLGRYMEYVTKCDEALARRRLDHVRRMPRAVARCHDGRHAG